MGGAAPAARVPSAPLRPSGTQRRPLHNRTEWLSGRPADAPPLPPPRARVPVSGYRPAVRTAIRRLQQCVKGDVPKRPRHATSRSSSTDAPPPPATSRTATAEPLRVVVLGPPGSGKTTLTERLRRAYGIVRVGCGDLLRAHALYHTELGRRARPYLEAQELVPDDVVIPMVMDRLSQRDCRLYGWVLDGFPRTRAQVQALRRLGDAASGGAMAATAPDPLRTVVVLEADARQLYERLSHRRIDPETHAVYNMKTYPPAEEEVRERLLRLAVEDEPVFAQRLQQYRDSLQEVLREIDPSGTGDDFFAKRADDGRRLIAVDVTQLGVRAAFQAVVDRLRQLRQVHLPPPQSTPSGNGDDPSAKHRTAVMALETVPVGSDGDDESRRRRRRVPQPVDWGATRTRGATAPVTHDALSAAPSTPTPNTDGATTTAPPPSSPPAPARNDSDLQLAKAPLTLIRCDGVQCVREMVHQGNITFHGSATEQVMLRWNRRPRTVLLLVKKGAHLTDIAKQAVLHLRDTEQLQVFVEPWMQTALFALGIYVDSYTTADQLHRSMDFVVCLGGDGLILHASNLFKSAVPPLISFNLGSLGFLTPFEWSTFPDDIHTMLRHDVMLSLRMRLRARVRRRNGDIAREFHVLNEVVVDRGASPFLCQLDCYWDDEPLADVQADGIIVATPTGSTAYSLAAGGAMVHPSVPAICFTPVCPHSLGLRPLVLPDSARIRVDVHVGARSHAWASFDGKNRLQLRRGDSLLVEMSEHPVPTVNATDQAADWFGSLSRGFGYSVRGARQKPRGAPTHDGFGDAEEEEQEEQEERDKEA